MQEYIQNLLDEKIVGDCGVVNRDKDSYLFLPPPESFSKFFFIHDQRIYYLFKEHESETMHHLKSLIDKEAKEYVNKVKTEFEREFSFQLPEEGCRLKLLKIYHQKFLKELDDITEDDEKDFMFDDSQDLSLIENLQPYLDLILMVFTRKSHDPARNIYNVVLNIPDEKDENYAKKTLHQHLTLQVIKWLIDEVRTEQMLMGIFKDDSALKVDKLTSKQQILLLHKLGVFDLSIIGKLTDIQKGKLFGALLNRSADNLENYIRYRKGYAKDLNAKYNIHTDTNIEIVNKILKELGLEKL